MMINRTCAAFAAVALGLSTESEDLADAGLNFKEREDGGREAIGLERVAGDRIAAKRSAVELVLVPGGRFLMGSAEDDELGYPDERPQHEVELASFYLARTPVTNTQYGEYLKANRTIAKPEYWGNPSYNQPEQPVVGVSWNEARAYCRWAGLVLPTDAQWEYACRAGTTTRYWSGDDEKDLARVGWYKDNSGGRLHAVGELEANGFGLCDMHGNVDEWCEDDWVGTYEGAVHRGGDGQKLKPGRDTNPAFRGGFFGFDARYARSAYRGWGRPDCRRGYVGFRPALGVILRGGDPSRSSWL
jgi:formylglycine-generating enzyme required for sulfatase activity